ncbi:Shikimate kinase I [Leucobacter sp. 7(1)]|uniref:shikimate kinase n=1 Tax=Leucobacter sp. 7(1) TaxID=1255613 RepID=UPI00097EC017|nr:shikimate kinase [Leucobacter sp. 7(1)]SJN12401.1 Shikimate kinase I [Leucobacter sp. 7(1)]
MTRHRRAGRIAGPPAAAPKPAPPTTPELQHPTEPIGLIPQSPRGSGRPRRRRRRRSGAKLPDRAVVFVGPMAAGKTSLGKRVARELGIPFVDSDAVFVRAHGAITDFFAKHGESEFRRIEAEVIAAELAAPGARILALGGGAVLTESTRELLSGYPVVLLMTTQEAVLRTANIQRRPLLRDDPEAWGRILAERRPLYEEVADVTYRTDRATKEQLARRVAQWARSFRKTREPKRTDGDTAPSNRSE